MAKELERMRNIRTKQVEVRTSLKHHEEVNKALREKITPIWVLEKEKRTPQLEALTKLLVEGRAKVVCYQMELHGLKCELKATNRSYDLSKSE